MKKHGTDLNPSSDVQQLPDAVVLNTPSEGLSYQEARQRLSIYGQNVITTAAKRSIFRLVIAQLKSSLIYMLIVASVLSFFLGDISDGCIILVILLINTGLGLFQQYRSDNAVSKLQKLVSKQILVRRSGKETLLAEHLIVPGDIIVLREGDLVPADAQLLHLDGLSVNESQLSGESVAVRKSLQESNNHLYAGSIVASGEGTAVVYATGMATKLGKIAHVSSSTVRKTPYELSLSSFSSFLIRVTFLTLALVFILKLVITGSTAHIGTLGLFVVALSITVVPEALPVIATVTLSSGAVRLAKRHVIAKTLTAVEDLGNITLLCSDKTGTLTQNKQTVQALYAPDKALFQKLAIASLESVDETRKKFQSSFDLAFLAYVPTAIQAAAGSYERLEELPFDPVARRRRVFFRDGTMCYVVVVGSVETLLAITKDRDAAQYQTIIAADGQNGLRHLGIAYKQVNYSSKADISSIANEKNLKFAGFVSLVDPLRSTTKHTIELAEKLGVQIKILSGDSRAVTAYVARQVGLVDQGMSVYTGQELSAMDDGAFEKAVTHNHAFAALEPDQKYRIISVLKRHNVVGYQGDGINDAPALKLADVAIAVNHASDVAQDSADIVLLRGDLGVIINGIHYGRAIFSNINKYIRFTMISNFGNFFAISALYLIAGTNLPLLPIQLVLTSLLTDVPCITIATDSVSASELSIPSKFDVHSLMFLSMFLGTITALFEVMDYALIKKQPTAVAQTALYLFLTLAALMVIISVRNKDHFWRAPRLSCMMKLSFGFVGVLSVIMIYIPLTKQLFHFHALPLPVLLLTLGLSGLYVLVLDVIKKWFYSLERTNLTPTVQATTP